VALPPALEQPKRALLARRLPVSARARLVAAARRSALPAPERWEHRQSLAAAMPERRRRKSTAARHSRLAQVTRQPLPARQALQGDLSPAARWAPGAEARAVAVWRGREVRRPVRLRAGRPEGRSTSDELVRMAAEFRQESKPVPPESVPARGPRPLPALAWFRRVVTHCRPACLPTRRLPARSHCNPSPCGPRSERKYTFCPAGTSRPCRISVRPPAPGPRSKMRSRPVRVHPQPIACGDSMPWLNMTW